MLDVEIRKRKVKTDGNSEKTIQYVVINGVADEDSLYSDKDAIRLHAYNEEVIESVLNETFDEVGKSFSKFSYGWEIDWWEDWLDIDIYCNEFRNVEFPQIKIGLIIQPWEDWSKPWSMSALAKELEKNILELGYENIKYWQEDPESMLNGFGVHFTSLNKNDQINNEIEKILNTLSSVIQKTNRNLLASIDQNSVLTYFHFPDEIKTACKQYLIYFTQFVADIGINVDSEIKEELNATLFRITPKDKSESLERIKDALSIYLTAPNDMNFELQKVNHNDIAIKQWESNILHLKSQVILADSIIQVKNAAIESLQLSNYQYQQILETHEAYKKSESEEIIKGVVTVDKYEGKGFSINLAEILRRLKRKFNE